MEDKFKKKSQNQILNQQKGKGWNWKKNNKKKNSIQIK
jgi:hypothetical protein